MKHSIIRTSVHTVLITLAFTVTLYSQITSAKTGPWNDVTTWTGGVVPTSGSNVVIASGHTVTLDSSSSQCNDLSVSGTLRFAINGSVTKLTVYGNAIVNSGGKLRVETRSPAGAANSYVEDTLVLYKNLTNNGTFDMRGGSTSGGTSIGALVKFVGSATSTITLSQSSYSSGGEEFNGITIDKTGSAKVVLAAGNLFMNSSSSVGPAVLTLKNGIVETGSNLWVSNATGSGAVTGASVNSYINGILGRGTNSSGETEKKFDIGDADGYRPIAIRTSTGGGGTSGFYVYASVVSGNANTGTSTFSGSIDSVNARRYYRIGYTQGAGVVDSTTFKQFTPTYDGDDDFTNTSLGMHVAYSVNGRATWVDAGPTNHVTDLSIPPTEIQCTSISPVLTVKTGGVMYVALAHGSGAPTGPIADSVNAKYCDANLQRYDLWKASSASPTPLLIYIHGGGLTSGSKADVSTSLVTKCLAKGISVMSVNYRLSPEVVFPQHFKDCARAIQYARYYATALNIDPNLIALGGSSAGALTSFWLGFHDDLADAGNIDPVLRRSSRAQALICWSGQTSVDSRVVGGWIDPVVLDFSSYFQGTIYGLASSAMTTPEAYALMEEASPYNYVNAGDPPAWMYYTYVNTPANSSEAIHHVGFGNHLKSKMDSVGLTSVVLTPSYTAGSVYDTAIGFLLSSFAAVSLPVELSTFDVSAENGAVRIRWTTATEHENAYFTVQRRDDASRIWNDVATVNGNGNSHTPHSYAVTDQHAATGDRTYRLRQTDRNGSVSYPGGLRTVRVGAVPSMLLLSENYPNPFNPETAMNFTVAAAGPAEVSVYNALGQQVTQLFNGSAVPGTVYTVRLSGASLASGMYVAILRSGGSFSARRMMLMK